MLVRFSKYLGVLTLSAVLSTVVVPAASAQDAAAQPAKAAGAKQPKDRGEYDLYVAVTGEQNPQKRLDLLNQWNQKYADTDYKKERLLFYLTTYQQLGKAAEMVDTANKILALDPKDVTALYWLTTLAVSSNDPSPTNIDRAEKSAQGLLSNLDETFAESKKPANADAAAWANAKKSMAALAHRGLGWAAAGRKNVDAAVSEYKQSLAADPNQGEIYLGLGTLLYGTKDETKIPEGLFYYARAIQYDGPNSLNAETRKKLDDFLGRAYKGFHGSTEGLDQLKALAKSNATPPPDFKIKSVKEIAGEKIKEENEAMAKDPMGAVWKGIKSELVSGGETYFNEKMKDSEMPELRGKVVSATPAARPNTIVLAISDDTTPEVTLKLAEGTMAGKAEPGTTITFSGAIPKSYTPTPFMVTMEVEKAKIKGWPAAAPPVRRPAAGAAHKKKK